MPRNKAALSGPAIMGPKHIISVECLRFQTDVTTSVPHTAEQTVQRCSLWVTWAAVLPKACAEVRIPRSLQEPDPCFQHRRRRTLSHLLCVRAEACLTFQTR